MTLFGRVQAVKKTVFSLIISMDMIQSKNNLFISLGHHLKFRHFALRWLEPDMILFT